MKPGAAADGAGVPLGDQLPRAREPKRIDISREYEVQYWARAFGVSREALLEAAGEVGDDARAVSRRLGKG